MKTQISPILATASSGLVVAANSFAEVAGAVQTATGALVGVMTCLWWLYIWVKELRKKPKSET